MLQEALQGNVWKNHKIGDTYSMKNDSGIWKIAYYPLFGTYKGGQYISFEEPRALVEKPMTSGTDFREIPLHFMKKINGN